MPVITLVNRDYAKAQYRKVKAKGHRNRRGCVIPKRLPRDDGYVRWTIAKKAVETAFKGASPMPTGEQSFYVHQLAYYAKYGTIPTRNHEHLSHLCDDSRCMNPKHLVVESPKVNNSRKNCRVTVTCQHCGESTDACAHNPKCIPR
jgi:hypothetical protein